jgi:hypothetical protein
MCSQPAAAKIADRFESVRGAGNVDFSADTLAQPLVLCPRRNIVDIRDLSNKLMSGCPSKSVITAQNFNVRVAYPGETNTNERPTLSQLR